jgi:hypothetical protein
MEKNNLLKGVNEEIVERNEKYVPNVFYVALIFTKIHQSN